MKIEVNLPDCCINKCNEHDIRIIIASALYDKGNIALGYAAESVGFDKRTLIENMGKYEVPVLKLNDEDIKRAIENGKRRAKSKIRR